MTEQSQETPKPVNRDRRFAPTTKKKSYDNKRGALSGIGRQCCRFHVEGLKNVAIAKRLNVTPETVANQLGSDLALAEIAILQQAMNASTVDVGKKILGMQEDAREVVEEIMSVGVKEENRLRSALYILGVGGHAPVQKRQTTGAVGIFDLKDIQDITNRIPKKEVKDENIEEAVVVD